MTARESMPEQTAEAGDRVRAALAARNAASEAFFPHQASRLATVSRDLAERFARGGRLLVFGRGPYATDAQHVAVEFVHPVIVGKRALPAIDLSTSFREALPALLRADDMAMGFGPPGGDPAVTAALDWARERGALTLALPGADAHHAFATPATDPFIHQELVEILYHTLWETVHVFLDHHGRAGTDQDLGATAFLYPFLGAAAQDTAALLPEVAASIRAKAEDVGRLRTALADHEAAHIADAAQRLARRIADGGTLLLFGNGGSATDANDLAHDCVASPKGHPAIAAISLAADAPNLSAIANDVGIESVFLRQLMAHARPSDVAIGISTSGSSGDVVAALEEAKKRQLLTVALTGYDGGEIARRGLADVLLVVRCDYIPRIQEAHASIYHILLDLLAS